MEIDSLQREVNRLKTEKEALTVKSKLFENFAAMAHSCCRLSSTAEWETVKATLQKTLQFSTELTGAEDGNLVLMDSNGTVTDFIQASGDTKQDNPFELIGRVLNEGIGGWVCEHRQVGLICYRRL
jgi:hypothetical protein